MCFFHKFSEETSPDRVIGFIIVKYIEKICPKKGISPLGEGIWCHGLVMKYHASLIMK